MVLLLKRRRRKAFIGFIGVFPFRASVNGLISPREVPDEGYNDRNNDIFRQLLIFGDLRDSRHKRGAFNLR